MNPESWCHRNDQAKSRHKANLDASRVQCLVGPRQQGEGRLLVWEPPQLGWTTVGSAGLSLHNASVSPVPPVP